MDEVINYDNTIPDVHRLTDEQLWEILEGPDPNKSNSNEADSNGSSDILPDVEVLDHENSVSDTEVVVEDETDVARDESDAPNPVQEVDDPKEVFVKRTVMMTEEALNSATTVEEQGQVSQDLLSFIQFHTQRLDVEQKTEVTKRIVEGLEEAGLMGELSLSYAHRRYDRLAYENTDDGITASDLDRKGWSLNDVEPHEAPDLLQKAFIDYLSEEQPDLADLSNDNLLFDDNISRKDLETGLAGYRSERVLKHDMLVVSDSLLNNDGQLYDFIDGLGSVSNDNPDGMVTKIDLQKYLDIAGRIYDAELMSPTIPMMSEQNIQAVRKIVDNWDEPLGERLRGGKYFIDRSSLAKANGFDSVEALEERVDQISIGGDGRIREDRPPYPPRDSEVENSEENVQSEESQESSDNQTEIDFEPQEDSTEEEINEDVFSEFDEENVEDSTVEKIDENNEVEDVEQETEAESENQETVSEIPVNDGEGYWHVARRLLGPDATNGEVALEMQRLQELNQNKMLMRGGFIKVSAA